MIENVSRTVRPTFPTPALRLTPERPASAPEVAVPHLMGLRTGAARPHRHKVPLRRLTAVTC